MNNRDGINNICLKLKKYNLIGRDYDTRCSIQ